VEAHLGSDLVEGPGQEVGSAHPGLEGAVFAYARLRKVDFTGAHLQGADFSRADLRGARFDCDKTPSEGCADLRGASFYRAQLQGAYLDGAELQGVNAVTGCILRRCTTARRVARRSTASGRHIQERAATRGTVYACTGAVHFVFESLRLESPSARHCNQGDTGHCSRNPPDISGTRVPGSGNLQLVGPLS